MVRVASQLHGIGEYVKRLEKIAEECGEKPKKQAAEKDEFIQLKKRCYELLEEVRDNIRERANVMKRRGNCYETIQKGHAIRKQLDELKKNRPRLQELHKKAQGRWTNKLTKEELKDRYKVIRLLKHQIDEADNLFVCTNAGGDFDEEAGGLGSAATLLGLRQTAAEEDTAASEYKTFMNDSGVDRATKAADADNKGKLKTRKDGELTTTKSDLKGAQGELDAALAYYDKLKPSCVDAGVNYEERVARREAEIQSLGEALKILSGEDI